MDLEFIDRTVARVHEEEPVFDWTEYGRIPLGEGVCGSGVIET